MSESAAAAERVARLLVERGETLAISESSAGGLISAALLGVPGASRFYLGGAVVYTTLSRSVLLGITPAQTEGIRSASPAYAALLSRTVRERFGAVWGLAETGATGPTGNRYGDPAGHLCLAVAGPAERNAVHLTGSADRQANMQRFTALALSLLADAIAATP